MADSAPQGSSALIPAMHAPSSPEGELEYGSDFESLSPTHEHIARAAPERENSPPPVSPTANARSLPQVAADAVGGAASPSGFKPNRSAEDAAATGNVRAANTAASPSRTTPSTADARSSPSPQRLAPSRTVGARAKTSSLEQAARVNSSSHKAVSETGEAALAPPVAATAHESALLAPHASMTEKLSSAPIKTRAQLTALAAGPLAQRVHRAAAKTNGRVGSRSAPGAHPTLTQTVPSFNASLVDAPAATQRAVRGTRRLPALSSAAGTAAHVDDGAAQRDDGLVSSMPPSASPSFAHVPRLQPLTSASEHADGVSDGATARGRSRGSRLRATASEYMDPDAAGTHPRPATSNPRSTAPRSQSRGNSVRGQRAAAFALGAAAASGRAGSSTPSSKRPPWNDRFSVANSLSRGPDASLPFASVSVSALDAAHVVASMQSLSSSDTRAALQSVVAAQQSVPTYNSLHQDMKRGTVARRPRMEVALDKVPVQETVAYLLSGGDSQAYEAAAETAAVLIAAARAPSARRRSSTASRPQSAAGGTGGQSSARGSARPVTPLQTVGPDGSIMLRVATGSPRTSVRPASSSGSRRRSASPTGRGFFMFDGDASAHSLVDGNEAEESDADSFLVSDAGSEVLHAAAANSAATTSRTGGAVRGRSSPKNDDAPDASGVAETEDAGVGSNDSVTASIERVAMFLRCIPPKDVLDQDPAAAEATHAVMSSFLNLVTLLLHAGSLPYTLMLEVLQVLRQAGLVDALKTIQAAMTHGAVTAAAIRAEAARAVSALAAGEDVLTSPDLVTEEFRRRILQQAGDDAAAAGLTAAAFANATGQAGLSPLRPPAMGTRVSSAHTLTSSMLSSQRTASEHRRASLSTTSLKVSSASPFKVGHLKSTFSAPLDASAYSHVNASNSDPTQATNMVHDGSNSDERAEHPPPVLLQELPSTETVEGADGVLPNVRVPPAASSNEETHAHRRPGAPQAHADTMLSPVHEAGGDSHGDEEGVTLTTPLPAFQPNPHVPSRSNSLTTETATHAAVEPLFVDAAVQTDTAGVWTPMTWGAPVEVTASVPPQTAGIDAICQAGDAQISSAAELPPQASDVHMANKEAEMTLHELASVDSLDYVHEMDSVQHMEGGVDPTPASLSGPNHWEAVGLLDVTPAASIEHVIHMPAEREGAQHLLQHAGVRALRVQAHEGPPNMDDLEDASYDASAIPAPPLPDADDSHDGPVQVVPNVQEAGSAPLASPHYAEPHVIMASSAEHDTAAASDADSMSSGAADATRGSEAVTDAVAAMPAAVDDVALASGLVDTGDHVTGLPSSASDAAALPSDISVQGGSPIADAASIVSSTLGLDAATQLQPIVVDEAEVEAEAAALHLHRLKVFAAREAPSMLQAIDTAWAKYGSEPMRVWNTIEKRFPGAIARYASDVDAAARERIVMRTRERLGLTDAAHAAEGVPEDAEAADTRPQDLLPLIEYIHTRRFAPLPSRLPPVDLCEVYLDASRYEEPAALVCGADLSIMCTVQALAMSPALPPEVADMLAAYVYTTPRRLNSAYTGARTAHLPASSMPASRGRPQSAAPLGFADVARALPTSAHTESLPAAQAALVCNALMTGSASVCRLTPGLPPTPPLADVARSLRTLSGPQMALLQFVKKIRPPPPCIVVALGVLCVLLQRATTWRAAVEVASEPDLMDKLLYVSTLTPEGSAEGAHSDNASASDASFWNNVQVSHGLSSMSHAQEPGTSMRPAVEHTRKPVTLEPPARPFPELHVTADMLNLARKLLNKRPDIRAEVRCLRLSIHASAEGDTYDAVEDAPFSTLIALVEWEFAYLLHTSDPPAAIPASADDAGDVEPDAGGVASRSRHVTPVESRMTSPRSAATSGMSDYSAAFLHRARSIDHMRADTRAGVQVPSQRSARPAARPDRDADGEQSGRAASTRPASALPATSSTRDASAWGAREDGADDEADAAAEQRQGRSRSRSRSRSNRPRPRSAADTEAPAVSNSMPLSRGDGRNAPQGGLEEEAAPGQAEESNASAQRRSRSKSRSRY